MSLQELVGELQQGGTVGGHGAGAGCGKAVLFHLGPVAFVGWAPVSVTIRH